MDNGEIFKVLGLTVSLRDTGMSRKVYQIQCSLELFSRDCKIGSHWYWVLVGSADNSDINKTIQQPLSKN